MKAKRIQRKRSKGWRMPDNTVYVGRPGKFRNMCRVGIDVQTNEQAVFHFKRNVLGNKNYCDMVIKELKGKNLACWCSLDKPCHADVLLQIANQ